MRFSIPLLMVALALPLPLAAQKSDPPIVVQTEAPTLAAGSLVLTSSGSAVSLMANESITFTETRVTNGMTADATSLTVPTDGFYLINMTISGASVSNGFAVREDGVTIPGLFIDTAGTASTSSSVSQIVKLSADQVISVNNAPGSNVTLNQTISGQLLASLTITQITNTSS